MTSRTTSASWLRGALELLQGAGLSAERLVEAAHMRPEELSNSEARAPTERVSALWRAAVELSGDPAIGLVGSGQPKPGNFDVVGFVMLSAHNLRASLQAFARHMRLVSDAAQIEIEDAAEGVRMNFHLFGGRDPIPRQRVEFDLLVVLTFCRWVSGRAIAPLELALAWPPCDYAGRMAAAFGCPIRFDAALNGLTFRPEDLETPLPAWNPMVAKAHDHIVRERLAAFDGASLSVRVRDEIARRLGEGELRRPTIAAALNLSDRTLRRRLQDENVSYEKLLDATRCDFAQHYLSRPSLSLTEIGYLLGFGDPSAFFRACRRWFGEPPAQFRARLRATRDGATGS